MAELSWLLSINDLTKQYKNTTESRKIEVKMSKRVRLMSKQEIKNPDGYRQGFLFINT